MVEDSLKQEGWAHVTEYLLLEHMPGMSPWSAALRLANVLGAYTFFEAGCRLFCFCTDVELPAALERATGRSRNCFVLLASDIQQGRKVAIDTTGVRLIRAHDD